MKEQEQEIGQQEESVKLVLEGSLEGFKRLEAMFESGELTEVLGHKILGISLIGPVQESKKQSSEPSL